MQMKITPIFNTQEIMLTTIKKDWDWFNASAIAIGYQLHAYIQSYVNSNRKRTGGTGNLAKSINFEPMAGAGTGMISWGIGNINNLNASAPYWYVVNYGKTVSGRPYIPNNGNFVPGRFRGGDGRPQASMRGKGVESFHYAPGSGMGMYPKRAIRPMNYISATRARLTREIALLLATFKGM